MKIRLFQTLAVLRGDAAEVPTLLERLRHMAERPGDVPSLPTLYRHLSAALDQGWVRVVEGDTGEGPGRPAQRYLLTARGREALGEEARRLARLADFALGDGGRGRRS